MGIGASSQEESRSTTDEMAPFKSDPEQKIRSLKRDIGRLEDKQAEVVDRIHRYLERWNRKYDKKQDPITQLLHFCDDLWQSQDTYFRLAESNRQEIITKNEELQRRTQTLHARDDEISTLKTTLEAKNEASRIADQSHAEEIQNFLDTIGKLNDNIKTMKIRREDELRRINQDHNNAVEGINAQHQYDLNKQQVDFDTQHKQDAWTLQNHIDHYDRMLHDRQTAHEQEMQRKEHECMQRIASLEADLLDNSDDFRPATDNVLKVKYRKLKLLIDTITDPFNLGVSGVTHLSHRLDPSNFLSREGNKYLRFLLRSIIWSIVMDGFFSLPFGFGALGPTGGRQQLLDVYRAWLRLYSAGNGGAVSQSYTQNELEIFERDKEANKWRSATFQSVVAAVKPPKAIGTGGSNQVSPAAFPSLNMSTAYAQNSSRVQAEILGVLDEVANGVVNGELQDSVPEITRLAGELALEFGAQRSQLGLMLPVRGDSIQIGEQFVDCTDGDGVKGSYVAVELVVCPCMFRIGDGRSDLKSGRTIFAGEIYPMRTQLP